MSKTHFTKNYLTKDGSVSIHHRNIQALTIELYKIKKGLFPEIFPNSCSYNLSRSNDFRIPSIRTFYHASEGISLLGLKI